MKLILRISKTNYFYDSKNITSTIARTINKLTRDKRVQNLEDTFQISEHNYDSKYFNFELSFIDNRKKSKIYYLRSKAFVLNELISSTKEQIYC